MQNTAQLSSIVIRICSVVSVDTHILYSRGRGGPHQQQEGRKECAETAQQGSDHSDKVAISIEKVMAH